MNVCMYERASVCMASVYTTRPCDILHSLQFPDESRRILRAKSPPGNSGFLPTARPVLSVPPAAQKAKLEAESGPRDSFLFLNFARSRVRAVAPVFSSALVGKIPEEHGF